MTHSDMKPVEYEVREVLGYFHNADAFESAVAAVEEVGIRRDAINLMASHDAVREKLRGHFTAVGEISENEILPQPIYWDRHEIDADKRIAIGLPVYIGGLGAGLAVVATGGTLAFAALLGAAGATAGAGIGRLIARHIGRHHAELLEDQLAKGALVATVEVSGELQENRVTKIMESHGADKVRAHTITRYDWFDHSPLQDFDPFEYW
ncbi:MAG: hypothetical protein JKP97_17680 [Rhodobacteraceae bacterium]|jgi:hypothetical protein|nr:hypothetical protein [Paracoccaceae bacterium]